MTTTDEDRADPARGDSGLRIEADLTVELPNAAIQVHTEGDTLYVESRTVAALRELRATAGSEAIDWLRGLDVESPLAIDTPVIVRLQGVPVARYHPAKPPGRLADRLGLSPFRPDLGGVLQAVWRLFRA